MIENDPSQIWQADMFQDNSPKWRIVEQGEDYCITEPLDWEHIKGKPIKKMPLVIDNNPENWE